jgi:ribonuclease HI
MSGDGDRSEGICAHLRACEEALLDPAVRRDRTQVEAMLAEDFEEIGASGRIWTRDQILELLASEDYQPVAMEDFKCDRIAEGVALVTYRTVKTDASSGLGAAALRSSIWTEESGEWRMRFHQGTRAL